LLLALESELVLSKAGEERVVALKDFYLGYKELNKSPDEMVVEIRFPKYGSETKVNWEKVSKRRWLDISTVNSALKIEIAGDTVRKATLALGGVAATPLYLPKASELLSGKQLTMDTVLEMLDVAMTEFKPIGDVRGSARYKRLLARQLMLAHFTKLFPEIFEEEATYAALR
jgi:xanthine dehydrogenase small subunit